MLGPMCAFRNVSRGYHVYVGVDTSGPLSGEVLFLGRDIGQLGQGCPSHPDPHVYRGPCKKNKLRPRFVSQLVGSGVRSCTVISRRHPIVKQKKVIVWSGPLSVEVLFLGRDIGQLGQGCPSHPTPHVYRGPCKKNKLRPRFFSQLVDPGVRSCTVISRMYPIAPRKKASVRSGPLSVEVLFLCRVLGHLGQG
jgi:hypothetical protein